MLKMLEIICLWPKCESSFKSNEELKKHESIHFDIKPYIC